jgi:multidrug efflux pump subunit AcrA (membrane-fusion protein)
MKHSRLRGFGLGLIVLAVWLLTACSSKQAPPPDKTPAMEISPAQIIGLGRIEPELKILDLQSETAGTVTKINVRPGDNVVRDQILLELSSSLEKAKLDLKAAQVRSQRSQIDAANAAVSSIRIKTGNAKLSFERAKSLYDQGAVTQAAFEAAKTEYESLLEEIKRLDAGVVAAEDLLKQTQADLRLSQAEFERRSLRALTDGQILSLEITVGSLVAPEKAFGTFAPRSPLIARCEIDEMFAGAVSLGQSAYLRTPGLTVPRARGTVTFAGPALRKKSLFSDEVGSLEDRRVREVWITLVPESRILFGTRVECVIAVKEK